MIKENVVRKGLVGTSVLIAICLTSSIGIGYSWEDNDPDPWNMSEFHNSHEEDVPPGDLDADISYQLQNGACDFVDITTYIGQGSGTKLDPIIVSDQPNKLLVFHARCVHNIVWDEDPEPPEGMTSMETTASLSLYRDIDPTPNENWVNKDYDNWGCELDEEGYKGDTFYLHVLEEDYDYMHGDMYRLDIYTSGIWWEGSTPHWPGTQSTSLYFKID